MARVKKRKPKSKKVLLKLFFLLICFLGIYLSFGVIKRELSRFCDLITVISGFQIKNINISGAGKKTERLVKAKLGLREGDSIFKLSTLDIYKRVTEVSWVKSVVVKKNLPNILNIEIKEATPIGIFQHDSISTLIDQDGVFIENVVEKIDNLPIIIGENANKNAKDILGLIAKFEIIRENIDLLKFIRERRWDIIVSGIKIKLPEKNVEKALKTFSTILKSGKINKNTAKSIDLRISGDVIINELRIKRKNNNQI
ncbi:MAG: cell division protein FtsQ [Holosporales bacterium]|jgi:cell division protein FtsQ|nr:cell division protein FtsQ [Holosporales bacterium]